MIWTIDPNHSAIEFSVKHMGISTVRGAFRKFEATAETDESGALTHVDATIDASSVDTNSPDRDAHLRSPDFFDAERHPTITFRSTDIRRRGDERYTIVGELGIRGQTRPVTFAATIGTPVTDPWGKRRAAAELDGKINRKEWGLVWNQVLELGALLVSEEVKFHFEVQLTANAEALAGV